MSDDKVLATFIRDELLRKGEGGLHAGYLSGGWDGFQFNFDGDINVDELATTIGEFIATKIDELAQAETTRTKWDGMAGMLGNWINGVFEGGRHIRRGLVDLPSARGKMTVTNNPPKRGRGGW